MPSRAESKDKTGCRTRAGHVLEVGKIASSKNENMHQGGGDLLRFKSIFVELSTPMPTKTAPAQKLSNAKELLTGRYFHSVENGKIHWQGIILGPVSEDTYLVQLFEWMMGEPSNQKLVTLTEMKSWLFYTNVEEMKHSYEYGVASKMKTPIRE